MCMCFYSGLGGRCKGDMGETDWVWAYNNPYPEGTDLSCVT